MGLTQARKSPESKRRDGCEERYSITLITRLRHVREACGTLTAWIGSPGVADHRPKATSPLFISKVCKRESSRS